MNEGASKAHCRPITATNEINICRQGTPTFNERDLCIKLLAYALPFKPFLSPTQAFNIHYVYGFPISGQSLFLIRVRHIDQTFGASFDFIYTDFLPPIFRRQAAMTTDFKLRARS